MLLFDSFWTLFQPSNLIFLGILFGFAFTGLGVRVLGRRLIGLSLLLAVIPSFFPVTQRLANALETRIAAPTPLPESVDGIIVLGGSVDWGVSQAWKQLSTNGAGERLMAANALAERYPRAKLVFTGIYKDIIPQEFVPSSTDLALFTGPEYANREIVFIGDARSTYEEALLSIERVQPRAGERWMMVTSAWHMPRALETFRTQGWSLLPYPADHKSLQGSSFSPSLDIMGNLDDLDEMVREWGALIIYNRTGRTEHLLP